MPGERLVRDIGQLSKPVEDILRRRPFEPGVQTARDTGGNPLRSLLVEAATTRRPRCTRRCPGDEEAARIDIEREHRVLLHGHLEKLAGIHPRHEAVLPPDQREGAWRARRLAPTVTGCGSPLGEDRAHGGGGFAVHVVSQAKRQTGSK